jgi:hypothetical protein
MSSLDSHNCLCDRMWRACNTHVSDEKLIQSSYQKILKEVYHFKYASVGTEKSKMNVIKHRFQSVDWIDLDEDRDNWRALVNIEMKIWALQKERGFLNWHILSFSGSTLPHHLVSNTNTECLPRKIIWNVSWINIEN